VTRLCLHCRVLVAAGTACPFGGRHPIVDLAEPWGRSELGAAVWGHTLPAFELDAQRRREMGAGLGAAVDPGWSGAAAGAMVFLSGLLLHSWTVGVSGGALAMLARLVTRARERRACYVPDPMGAPAPAPSPDPVVSAPALTGVAEGTPQLAAPLSGRPCLAFAVRLLARKGSRWPRVLLSYGRGGDFLAVRPEGGRVQVRAGALALLDAPAEESSRAISEEQVQALLAGLFAATAVRAPDLEIMFPWLWVQESLLLPGDRIQLVARLDPGGQAVAADCCPLAYKEDRVAASPPGRGPAPRIRGWGRVQ
jgi:hypothetical protein